MHKLTLSLVTGVALLGISACQSGTATGPDEFRVVKKAPLVIPPEYNLRPPQAGQAQPAEIATSRADIAQVFGAAVGQDASASERALVEAAGAQAVNPIIREQVDFEEAKIIRKSPTVSDRIMFWRGEPDEAAVDDSATGGEAVTIGRGNDGGGLKLPGT